MAAFFQVTSNTIRNSAATSLYGRRLGLMLPNDILQGASDIRRPIVAATSDTTAALIPGYGFNTVDTTTDDGWMLGPPVPGCKCELFTATTSTGTRTITMGSTIGTGAATTNWAIMSSAGAAYNTITIKGGGQYLELVGLSSALYGIVTRGTGGIASSAVSTEMVIS